MNDRIVVRVRRRSAIAAALIRLIGLRLRLKPLIRLGDLLLDRAITIEEPPRHDV